MNIFNDNKGFFQRGKSFGGKGFIEPLLEMLRNRQMDTGSMNKPNAPTAQGFSPMMTEEELKRLHPEWFANEQQQAVPQMPYIPQRTQQTQIGGLR